MAINKGDIVRSVVRDVRFKRRQKIRQQFLFPEMYFEPLSSKRASAIVDRVFETIKNALAKGEEVRIPNFGRFRVRFRWAREGRNPKTGEKIFLRSRSSVTFRASAGLRRKLNP
jgi:nucleoid DNA-binding protein